MKIVASFALAFVILFGSFARAGIAQTMALPVPVGMAGDPAAQAVLDGNTAFEAGDLGGASHDYALALRRKPNFAVATFNLGLVEIHQGKRTIGLAHMDRGIRLATQNGMSSGYIRRLRALRNAFTSESA